MTQPSDGELLAERRAEEILGYQDQLANLLPPIAGGASAVVPLAVALGPMLLEEIPKIFASLLSIVNAIRTHPETPAAAKAQMDAVFAHLDAAAAAVAAVQV